MKIFIVIGCFLLLVIIIFILSVLYDIHERHYINKIVAKNLNYLMEIDYVGSFRDIRRNYDMFCTYASYIEEHYISEDNKDKLVNIVFKLKQENIDKEKFCLKYLKICERKKNIYEFLEENYEISVNFL